MRLRPGALVLVALVTIPSGAVVGGQAPPDRAAIMRAAREIITSSRYCTFVTVDADGQPQARTVGPFPAEDDLTVWLATKRASRKVTQLRHNPRATLSCFDPATMDQVQVLGKAEIVESPAERAKRWKPAWKGMYQDENRGDDYLLLRLKPARIEVASASRRLPNDPVTWKPVVLDLGPPR